MGTVATVVGAARAAREGKRAACAVRPAIEVAPVTRSRRAQRREARSVLQSFSTLRRIRGCGRPLGPEVSVMATATKTGVTAGVGGVETCGSVWACPVCSAKIAATRCADLQAAIEQWTSPRWRARKGRTPGASVAMLTLTIRHRKGQRLDALWDDVSAAWRRLVSSRAYKSATRKYGAQGYYRTTEVTEGANGWHVHLHVLYFLDGVPSPADARAFGAALIGQWCSDVRALGRTSDEAVQHFKVFTGTREALAEVSAYVTKTVYAGADRLAMEQTRGDLKAGKRNGQRNPWRILDAVLDLVREDGTVSGSDWALWQEWETASMGRRQSVWSRGFRDLLDLGNELSDEEAADDSAGGEALVNVPAAYWRRFAADGVREAALLDAIETAGDLDEARAICADFLTQCGVPFNHPTDSAIGD